MATIDDFSSSFLHSNTAQFVDPKTLDDSAHVQCPNCGTASMMREWTCIPDAVYCDVCDAHDALECPKCNEGFDSMSTHFNIFHKITNVL